MSPAAKQRILRWVRYVSLVLILAAIATFLLAGGLLYNLELFASDVLFRLRGPITDETPVVVVAIDNASFTQNRYQWPWPREYIARIVDQIAVGQPSVIALDIQFYEPSTAEADAELARAIGEAGNVVLVNNITAETRQGISISTYNRPIPELDAVATLGLTNIPRDPDGAVRRVLGFQAHNGELFFSWALQVARIYLGEEDFTVLSADRILIGDHPVDLQDQFLVVNFRGEPAATVPYYSAYQVADGLVDPSVFAGKIVLFGATDESFHDTYLTPFIGIPPTPMPGVEVIGHAIDTILNERYIHRLPTNSLPQFLVAVAAAALAVFLTIRLRPVPGLLVSAVLILLYLVAAVIIFANLRLIFPIMAPVIAGGLTFLANTSLQLYEEQRARTRIRDLFDRYVSSAAIDQMLSNPEGVPLTGQRRELSILFSDIRGFTSLSEQLTPDQVVAILNEYLEEMTQIIFAHGGTIDKFLGDAILAFWNAPLEMDDYPTRAVECAIDMAHKLSALQRDWAASGEIVLRAGIGIATGTCFVGNIGSEKRLNYTVIGDTVNLASRLEALTKDVGVQILYNDRTQELLGPAITSRFVTEAQVKGRHESARVYTVDPVAHDMAVDEGTEIDKLPEHFIQERK